MSWHTGGPTVSLPALGDVPIQSPEVREEEVTSSGALWEGDGLRQNWNSGHGGSWKLCSANPEEAVRINSVLQTHESVYPIWSSMHSTQMKLLPGCHHRGLKGGGNSHEFINYKQCITATSKCHDDQSKQTWLRRGDIFAEKGMEFWRDEKGERGEEVKSQWYCPYY